MEKIKALEWLLNLLVGNTLSLHRRTAVIVTCNVIVEGSLSEVPDTTDLHTDLLMIKSLLDATDYAPALGILRARMAGMVHVPEADRVANDHSEGLLERTANEYAGCGGMELHVGDVRSGMHVFVDGSHMVRTSSVIERLSNIVIDTRNGIADTQRYQLVKSITEYIDDLKACSEVKSTI